MESRGLSGASAEDEGVRQLGIEVRYGGSVVQKQDIGGANANDWDES